MHLPHGASLCSRLPSVPEFTLQNRTWSPGSGPAAEFVHSPGDSHRLHHENHHAHGWFRSGFYTSILSSTQPWPISGQGRIADARELWLSSLFMGPLAGHAADRWGSRRVIITGLLVLSVGTGLHLFLPNGMTTSTLGLRLLVVAGQGIMGLGAAMFGAPNTSAAMQSVAPAQRGVASGFALDNLIRWPGIWRGPGRIAFTCWSGRDGRSRPESTGGVWDADHLAGHRGCVIFPERFARTNVNPNLPMVLRRRIHLKSSMRGVFRHAQPKLGPIVL